MYKKTVTYKDYNNNERKEELRFHLNMAELTELNYSVPGGMEKYLKKIMETEDVGALLNFFKTLLLKSYGELSDDGKLFVKVKDGRRLAEDFEQSEAYSTLYMELASNEESASDFITHVVPAEMAEKISQVKAIPGA